MSLVMCFVFVCLVKISNLLERLVAIGTRSTVAKRVAQQINYSFLISQDTNPIKV